MGVTFIFFKSKTLEVNYILGQNDSYDC